MGFLLSDYVTSSRWQYDRDDFEAALHKLVPDANVIVEGFEMAPNQRRLHAAAEALAR